MRVIEDIIIHQDLDPYLSLEAASKYSGLSVRYLRGCLSDPTNPLPHFRMREPHVVPMKGGKTRTVTGKILIRKSVFDTWMQQFSHTPSLDQIVDETLQEISG